MRTKITQILSLLIFILCGHVSSAQVFVNQSATGSNDGTSWENAFTDLTVALEGTMSGEVWVASGTYLPSNTALDTFNRFPITSSISLYGGFLGTEATIADRVDGNTTILSGDMNGDDIDNNFEQNKEDNVFHVVSVIDTTNGIVIIDGFTIMGGNTNTSNADVNFNWAGGAIFAASTIEVNNCNFNNNFGRAGGSVYISSDLDTGGDNSKITNCTFERNAATAQSAGIFSANLDGFTVSGCTFTNNRTARGAFYPLFCTNLLVDDCTFSNNADPSDGFGGAMFIWSSRGEIRNTTFSENQAGNAAGIYFDGRSDTKGASNMLFDNCTFTTNICSGFGGGGIYAFRSSYTMTNCTFDDNTSGNSGGAIFNTGGDMEVNISNTVFSRNTASFGAAHTNYGMNSEYTLTGNTYTANEALTSGGGMINGFGSKVDIADCEFNENFANFGAGVYSQNDTTAVTIQNSIFQSNNALNGAGGVHIGGPVSHSIGGSSFIENTGIFGGALGGAERSQGEFGEITLEIDRSLFVANRASTQGAGLSLVDFDLNMTNSLVAANLNTGEGAGGGFSINATDSSTVAVSISHSTIASNFALIGPGIAGFTGDLSSIVDITMVNSILANEGFNYEIEGGTPTFTSQGGNISTDETTVDIFTAEGDISEADDILFTDIGEADYSLQGGSPAINIGVTTSITTDILGNPRTGQPDAGAYEALLDATEDILKNNGQLAITPNVVSTLMNVNLDNNWTGNIDIQILDITGKTLINNEIQKNSAHVETAINVTQLSSGSYYLMVRSNNEVLTSQFMKI